MASSLWVCGFVLLVLTLHQQACSVLSIASSNVYIVYMGEKQPHDEPKLIQDSHHEVLSHLLGSEDARNSILYSYKHGFSGFAAVLTQSQSKLIADFPGVVRVIPNRIHSLHTTRSWDFLRINPHMVNGILSKNQSGPGTIIGILDTGIWPESKSFKDEGMGEVPSRWKGVCQGGQEFNHSNCNRKIIGARWYVKGYEAEFGKIDTSGGVEFLSPRDADGHGTHTSSTAAGALVENASLKGLARGVARGGAPSSRLAIYKVCWSTGGCSSADLLAAFDDAIFDGVDVLSVSLGSSPPLSAYVDDVVAIGSFHAVAKGISVVCSAGNSGPYSQTVINTAPWIITVGASTIDRAFPTLITFGNNKTVVGQAVYTGKDAKKFYPIAFGEDIASIDADEDSARSCNTGALNATLAKGKVILCFQARTQRLITVATRTVRDAGGTGLIFALTPTKDVAISWDIPIVQVDFVIGTSLLTYIGVTSNPKVKFSLTSTVVGQQISPEVAYFSSRGPSSLSPSVLKPDIAAPGVNILASWSPAASIHMQPPLNFNIESGTSMACPHISAIVALLKSNHPTWSPAAIKSALVTTGIDIQSETLPRYFYKPRTDRLKVKAVRENEPTIFPSVTSLYLFQNAASLEDEFDQRIVAEGGPDKQGDPFDYGGGHVNLNKAIFPGLIFDMGIQDYTRFLCSLGYNNTVINSMTRTQSSCRRKSPNFLKNLNLPSITIPGLHKSLTVSRTVTNVGPVTSVYTARVEAPPGTNVSVHPWILSFNCTVKKLKFKVVVQSQKRVQGRYSFGNLFWEDGLHVVRVPLVVRSVITDFYADT